ncbi:PhnE/PtxC family ABC transporter permease [Fusibacter sp. JL216-2]|uniref:PhnE/PtxC family ABC transporter permease n=1 Tax=Fusibacter sp. JL216-2 TaxID=3071453 RepID=UPI003D335DFA
MNKRFMNFFITLTILWGFQSVDWTEELIHKGGYAMAKQLLEGVLHPDLSQDVILRTLHAAGITSAYAIAGMSVSILIALILGVFASGVLSKHHSPRTRLPFISRAVRSLLTFMRSIHELVWAWLFVAAFGLHPLSAILALGIPYGGTLGRIFADMLLDVPEDPIQALDITGAGRLQKLFYVYLPHALPNMVSYAMYRFECAIRASTVMSFVGLGGLGYYIQLSLSDLEYNEAFTYLYGLIALIFLIEVWSSQLRKSMDLGNSRTWNLRKLSLIMSFVGAIGAWSFIHITEGIYLRDLINDKNLHFTIKFLKGLLGFGETLPAFLDKAKWVSALGLSLETLQMSILSICLASLFAILLAIPASRMEKQTDGPIVSVVQKTSFTILRAIFIGARAVPELVWAMFFVFLFKPGPLPGVLALAVHNFGILGKLFAEVVENMEQSPLESLRVSGANTTQRLFYGLIPMVLPKFITYILYRWEVIIRTTIIVGFVGAGGLGQAFKLSMSWFHYSDVTLYLICYLGLIGGVDKLSRVLRRYAF